MRSRLARTVAVLFLAIAAAACSKTLKTDQLEPQLKSQLETQLNTTGVSVSCPTGIKAETGGKFDCTATLSDGTTLTINVTQSDASGHVTWSVAGASPSPSASS
jgi:hypothetical protein